MEGIHMHSYFDDRFDGLDFGARRVHYTKVSPSSPSPTPTTTLHTRTVKVDGRTKSVPVTPTDQVIEAVKDAKISSKEKTAFDKSPVTKEIIAAGRDRLTEAVRRTDDDIARGEDGRAVIKDGKVQADAAGVRNTTEHEARVDRLAQTKDAASLEKIDEQIAKLEQSGSSVGLEALKAQREERAASEGVVAAVINDKEALVGTLEAEKLDLQGSVNADAADDFLPLRTEAQQWIDQFNANGGQYYEGNDLFGDDWDTSEVDFDRLAERFSGDPDKLAEFVDVQGRTDGDLRGKSLEEVEAYLTEMEDPEEAARIALRYQAASELQGVFERYNTASEGAAGNGARIEQLDGEIGYLNETIERDRASLSAETLAAIDADNAPIDGIIEPEAGQETTPTPTESDTPSSGGPTKTPPATPTEEKPSTPTKTPPATPTPSEAKIDWSTPERSAQVLQQAAERNLLPAENTSFNEQGQAVYTVQNNDSYWRIADMSDGRPPHEFDSQHFQANVISNSERLGRDPQVGLIHPNEQVIIANRSLDELIMMLELPTVEAAAVEATAVEEGPVEPENAPHAHGANQPR
jgi:hypothetical protein